MSRAISPARLETEFDFAFTCDFESLVTDRFGILEDVVCDWILNHLSILIQIAKLSQKPEYRLADLGDERRDIIITDVLDTIPFGSTINARVDSVGAPDASLTSICFR